MNAKGRRRERRKNRATVINAVDASQRNIAEEDYKVTEVLLHPPAHTRRIWMYIGLLAGSLLCWAFIIYLINWLTK